MKFKRCRSKPLAALYADHNVLGHISMQLTAHDNIKDDQIITVTTCSKPSHFLRHLRDRLVDVPLNGIRIHWPTSASGRARTVITRSGIRRRYVIPCFRFEDREAHCEAVEEAAACIILDACHGMEFQEQPVRFEFTWLGKTHEHFPDVLVACKNRYEFWECKRKQETSDFMTRKRAEHLRALLEPIGVGYRVISGKELFADAFLENARLLRRFAKHPVSESEKVEARLQVGQVGKCTLQQLAAMLASAEPISDVLAMIYNGDLCTDLRLKLTRSSLVNIPENNRSLPWVWQILNVDNV